MDGFIQGKISLKSFSCENAPGDLESALSRSRFQAESWRGGQIVTTQVESSLAHSFIVNQTVLVLHNGTSKSLPISLAKVQYK